MLRELYIGKKYVASTLIKKTPNTVDINMQSRLNPLKEILICFSLNNINNNNKKKNNNNNNNNNNNFLLPRPPLSPSSPPPKQDNFFFNLIFHHNKQLNKIIFGTASKIFDRKDHWRS